MTSTLRLSADAYVGFVTAESARFTDLLAQADPTARVPACPDWDAADLLWHLTEVQWFWGSIVTRQLSDHRAAEADKPERPAELASLVDLQRRATDRLTAALATGADTDRMWTWYEAEQTRGFIQRRQAHEALIHRLDAEQVADQPTPLDPALATDGVDEALRVMFGGIPDWARFHAEADGVQLTTVDSGARWTIVPGRAVGTVPDDGEEIDEPSLEVLDGRAADPVAQVSADASTLDAWLWGRLPEDAVTRTGDDKALAELDRVVKSGLQ